MESTTEPAGLFKLRHLDGVPYEIKELGYVRLVCAISSILFGLVSSFYYIIWVLLFALATFGIGLLLIVFLVFPIMWIVLGVISLLNANKLTGEDRSKHKFATWLAIIEILSVFFFCPLAISGFLSFYMRRNKTVDNYLREVGG